MTFAACSSENLDTPQVPLTINATIDGVATRADDSFGEGAQIGVYIEAETEAETRTNVLFQTSDGSNFSTPSGVAPIYFNSEEMVVKAYYPYNENGSWTVQTTDQNSLQNYLYAECKASAATGTAVLTFKHLLCKLTLKFSLGEGYDGIAMDAPSSVTIDGIKTEGVYNAPYERIDVLNSSGETLSISSGLVGTTVELRVIPQTLESKSFTLTATYEGNEYSATVPVKDGELLANKNYIYNVKIDQEKLTVSSSSAISAWDEKKSDDAVDVVYSGDVTSSAVVTTDHGE
jgi:hypothetical protein